MDDAAPESPMKKEEANVKQKEVAEADGVGAEDVDPQPAGTAKKRRKLKQSRKTL